MPATPAPVAAGFTFGMVSCRRLMASVSRATVALSLPAAAPEIAFAHHARRRGGFVVETLELQLRNGGLDEAFDTPDLVSFLRRCEGKGIANGRRAARPPNAVNVIVGRHRDIVVDHVRNSCDVDSAGCDIRGDHDLVFAIFKTLERGCPLTLAAIAVEDRDRMASLLQAQGDLVGSVLGAGENQHAVKIRFFKQREKQGEFQSLADWIDGMRDRFIDGSCSPDGNAHGIREREPRHSLDFGRHGGRKEKGLAFFRAKADDGFDVVDKTHVEHAVDLVEHQHLEVIQPQRTLLEKIHQTSDRCDDDVAAFVQSISLRPVTNATMDQRGAEIGKLPEFAERFVDLRRQFTRGFKYQHARRGEFVRPQAVENWEGERRGFSRAGLRGSNQVATAQDHRDGLLLDWSGFAVALGGDGANDTGIKPKLGERHGANAVVKSAKGEGKIHDRQYAPAGANCTCKLRD